MRKIIGMTIAAATAVFLFAAPTFADTLVDNEPVFKGNTVNRVAKSDQAAFQTVNAFKAHDSRAAIKSYDQRYKQPGQGNYDAR